MATQFGSTSLTSYHSYSGLTIIVNFEAYYDGNQWFGRIPSIGIHSESGGAYGWTCYLNGSFYVNGQLIGSSAFAGEHSCYIGNQSSTFWFSRLPKDTAWMSMGSCSARNVSVSFNCSLHSQSGSSYWADGTSFSGSGTMSLSAISHNIVNGGTANAHQKCSRCGVVTSTAHSYTSSVLIPATCTASGTTKYTCACGYSYTSQNIGALGHDYIGSVVSPTCTTGGYTKYKCSRCDDTSKANDTYTEALGHSYSSTTNADGSTTYTCTVCGSSYTVASKKTKEYTAYIYKNGSAKKYKSYIYKDLTWKLRQEHIFNGTSGS